MISLSVKYLPKISVVKTVSTGVVARAELLEETKQTVAIEHDWSRFPSDFSNAQVAFTAADVYELPRLQQKLGLKRDSRVAVIAPADERGRKLARFYETVSENRGWNAAVFEDGDQALDWLLK